MPADFTHLAHVGLNHYLGLAAVLFSIGALGVLLRKNMMVILMSIELMLNAVNLTFVAFSKYQSDLNGQVVVLFVMAIAAAEAAVGLAIAVAVYRRFHEVNVARFERLKG